MMHLVLIQISDTEYRAADGTTVQREYGKTPNGNNVGGAWVLRDVEGEWIDHDTYINDLRERNKLELVDKE